MRWDVIILGAGIIGCTLGQNLTRRGQRVLVLDPGEVAGGTSAASFAWANAASKTGDEAYHRLNAAGVAGYRALAEVHGAASLGIAAAGSLQIVTADDRAGLAALDHDQTALARFGYRVERLDTAALAAAEPDLAIAPGSVALHCPDDLVVDAPRFTRFMAGRIESGGGAVRRAGAGGLLADEDGTVRGVETRDGILEADHVVLACGRDTGAVLARITGYDGFAGRFPIRQVPGLLLTTPPVAPGTLGHVVFTSTADELHMLPAPGGGIRIGSDDVDGMIWEDRSDAAMRAGGRALLARAERFLPGLAERVEVTDCDLRIGIRPYPEDGKTISGPLPGALGLWVVATHSGITLAPVLADLMAAWITTGHRPDQLAPYGLDRFPGFA